MKESSMDGDPNPYTMYASLPCFPNLERSIFVKCVALTVCGEFIR